MPKWNIQARAKQWSQGTWLLSIPPYVTTHYEKVFRKQIGRAVERLMREAYRRGRDDEAQERREVNDNK